MDISKVKSLILGEIAPEYYVAAFFFSGLAILLSLYLQSLKRDKTSTSTPVHYSWKFLLWDNAKRIMAGIITAFLFYRFPGQALSHSLDMWVAVAIGFLLSFGVDRAIMMIMKRANGSVFDQDRDEYMKKMLDKYLAEIENKKS
jgi:hypothetical protein